MNNPDGDTDRVTQDLISSILEEDMSETLRADLMGNLGQQRKPTGAAGRMSNTARLQQQWPERIDEGDEERQNLWAMIPADEMTETLRMDIFAASTLPVRAHVREDGVQAKAEVETALRVIREAVAVRDFRNAEFKSAVGQLTAVYNRVENSDLDNKRAVLEEIIILLLEREVLGALSIVLRDQLVECSKYFNTSHDFGGVHYQLVVCLTAFFSYYASRSHTFARLVSDGSCALLDCLNSMLKTLKVAHFLKSMNERIDNFLLAGLKLAFKIVSHNDTETILCVKDRDVINFVRPYQYSADPAFQLSAILFIAIVEEKADYRMHSPSPLALKALLDAIENEDEDYKTSQLIFAVENLIGFEGNIEMLMELKLLSILKRLLTQEKEEKIQWSLHVLGLLATDVERAESIFDEVFDILRTRLANHQHEIVRNRCQAMIRLLQEKIGTRRDFRLMARPGTQTELHPRERANQENEFNAVQNARHIMLSYCWDDQQKVCSLKNFLASSGFEIWFDNDKMCQGSVFESMAKAVDNAWLVLICFSRSYSHSRNCQREAEYAERIHKPIIPVRLENFHTDGWLGLLLANYFTHDMSDGITDRALYDLISNITRLRANRLDGEPEMLTILHR